MRRVLFFLFVVLFLTSCDGYYNITGSVCEIKDGMKTPIDSVNVKVYVGWDWLRAQTLTDTIGHFILGGTTAPMASPYYLVFTKKGFKTDTVSKQGTSGSTIFSCEHIMVRKQNI